MSTNIILIQKYLAKSISPEERDRLEVWLAEHPDNRQIFADYEKIWSISTDYQVPTAVDANAGLARFKQRIAKEQLAQTSQTPEPSRSLGKPTRLSRPMVWMASAAAVLLLVVSGFLLNNLFFQKQQMVVVKTADTTESVQLPDGSQVSINGHSTFSYPKQFTGEKRMVRLEGEAFFEVAKDAGHPFVIESPSSEVTVLGTSFNVRAYPSEEQTEVAVTSGKVRFAGRSADKAFKFVLLEANDKGIYLKEEKKIITQQDKMLNSSSWKTQVLTFNDTRVSQVFAAVGKHYNIQFNTTNTRSLNCELTSSFENSDLEVVLEHLRASLGVKIEKTENIYTVSGGKHCS